MPNGKNCGRKTTGIRRGSIGNEAKSGSEKKQQNHVNEIIIQSVSSRQCSASPSVGTRNGIWQGSNTGITRIINNGDVE